MWQGWGKISLAAMPFGAACYLADRCWHPSNLPIFFIQIIVTLPIYGIGVGVMFRHEAVKLFSKWRQSKLAIA